MVSPLPQAVLFCCDHNAIRSPMAEGIMKKLYGMDTYVQSAGVKNDLEIDGFAIGVCEEIGVELSRHRSRSFEEMDKFGDDLASFDLIVALTPTSLARAQELTRIYATEVERWDITDPSGAGERREDKQDAYRKTRDQIIDHLTRRWGPGKG